jgi:hypothetical protein
MGSPGCEPIGWRERSSHECSAPVVPLSNPQEGREDGYLGRTLRGGSSEPQNGLAGQDQSV